MTDRISLPAPAKLNLFLRVLAREADGFHSIETLFCRLDLADELTAERQSGTEVSIEVAGADTGPAADNLAVRAARLVLEATGRRFGVHLTLTKRVPVRAGLGGGSSDAATALTAVNRLAGDAIPRHELLQLAARLGSDVPFFASGATLALGWGHGERMLVLPGLPRASGLLVIPERGVSTAEAYQWVDGARDGAGRRGAVALSAESLATWGDVARMAGNDFESPVFGRRPEVRAAFEVLATTHPLVCRMSGSGSALFAIYRTAGEREDAKLRLGRKHGAIIGFETA
ncbi:MAG TPA: 4-(cytidine 5'-diphospho)-2-C-methyl-D-erythritol kinase [Gemmatimonadales bacterium]|nr:4-(cytidine 5'-diphospho)-2-C-methyl-D-erythritol kinase [Gemmatimonadales bacterium]